MLEDEDVYKFLLNDEEEESDVQSIDKEDVGLIDDPERYLRDEDENSSE